MAGNGSIPKAFYSAVQKGNLAEARTYLDDRLVFVGIFETYRSADQYLQAPRGDYLMTRSRLVSLYDPALSR
ncbi:MAG TPA: hypothetical protein VMF59_12205 [Bacteroidota bacterium]|nr:hypothetical protein [Bacteroidota bacterium]